jgi:hypothetical protein
VTLAVVRNTEGFRTVDVRPKGVMFDINHYCEDILSEILRACLVRLHCRLGPMPANARPHTWKQTLELMAENNLRGAPHPPFSPYLARSDFFSFG